MSHIRKRLPENDETSATNLDPPSLATTVATQQNTSSLVRSNEDSTLHTVPGDALFIDLAVGLDKNETLSVNTTLIGTGPHDPLNGINVGEPITQDKSRPVETSETGERIPEVDATNVTDKFSLSTSDIGTGDVGSNGGAEALPSETGNEVNTKTQTSQLSGEIHDGPLLKNSTQEIKTNGLIEPQTNQGAIEETPLGDEESNLHSISWQNVSALDVVNGVDESHNITIPESSGPTHSPQSFSPGSHASHIDTKVVPSTDVDDDGIVIVHCKFLVCKLKIAIHSHPIGFGVVMVLLVLLCLRRCRTVTNRDNATRGEYRAVAAQYEEMLFDNFNDDYSAGADDQSVTSYFSDENNDHADQDDWSSGPRKGIELTSIRQQEVNGGLTLAEMNG